nr:hypothetical protein MACL_00003682 [Theileria orientalis]
MRSTSTFSSVVSSVIPSIRNASQPTNSVTLDFGASQVSPDLVVNTSIPGVIKYSSANGKKLDKIAGNQQFIEFHKEIDHVFSNSPFNGNITVVFKDSSNEQFFLQSNGFVRVAPDQSSSQASAKPGTQTLLELDLINPSAQFTLEEVGNIKCYKPKGPRELVSKIIIGDANRSVEHQVKENFICYTQDNGRYSILVAYLTTENKWLKYTLSKQQNTNILMDVSLMRTFDDIDMANIFADHSTPYDNEVFSYDNLKINRNDVGKLMSQTTGNLRFHLDVREQGGKTERINVVFDKHFIIDEGFKFHSIRSKNNYEQMMFTYVNDNVVHHEKYVKRGNVYKKDLNAVNKHDLKRTKTIIGRENIDDENVLFYTTIVPDALHQGIEISHHGRFKVFDFEKGKERFVIFPNMEFYLSKDQDHRLILCENGESVSLVMKTTSNNNRVDYIASTDPLKGNPLAIKGLLKDFDFTKKSSGMSTLKGGLQPEAADEVISVVEGPPVISQPMPADATPPITTQPPTTDTVATPPPVTATAPIVTRRASTDSDEEISVVEGPMLNLTPSQPTQQPPQESQQPALQPQEQPDQDQQQASQPQEQEQPDQEHQHESQPQVQEQPQSSEQPEPSEQQEQPQSTEEPEQDATQDQPSEHQEQVAQPKAQEQSTDQQESHSQQDGSQQTIQQQVIQPQQTQPQQTIQPQQAQPQQTIQPQQAQPQQTIQPQQAQPQQTIQPQQAQPQQTIQPQQAIKPQQQQQDEEDDDDDLAVVLGPMEVSQTQTQPAAPTPPAQHSPPPSPTPQVQPQPVTVPAEDDGWFTVPDSSQQTATQSTPQPQQTSQPKSGSKADSDDEDMAVVEGPMMFSQAAPASQPASNGQNGNRAQAR